ncbi:MAG: helix-turn-helix transcriptional regulator, partial [Sphaerochaeta associata]|uniref:helix-turn-helix domain-containing protein n=1 Tax=Sphaerochaeta associata TaxID=1129264 RepID=UPI002B1EA60B
QREEIPTIKQDILHGSRRTSSNATYGKKTCYEFKLIIVICSIDICISRTWMHKDFWKRVRNLITEYGLKLAEIENTLGLPNSYISVGTLRGGLPRADTILKLADYFGVSFRWLVTGEDDDESISKYSKIASNPQLLELANKLSYCNPELLDIIQRLVDYNLRRRV